MWGTATISLDVIGCALSPSTIVAVVTVEGTNDRIDRGRQPHSVVSEPVRSVGTCTNGYGPPGIGGHVESSHGSGRGVQ